jgi:hypothetical protein
LFHVAHFAGGVLRDALEVGVQDGR